MTLTDYVTQVTGLSYGQALDLASGAVSVDAGQPHAAIARALHDGWAAAEQAAAVPAATQDPFAVLAADAPLDLAGAA